MASPPRSCAAKISASSRRPSCATSSSSTPSYARRAGIGLEELITRAEGILDLVSLLDAASLAPAAGHPWVLACAQVDPDDAPYVAACVVGGAELLWTADKAILRAFPAFAREVIH